MYAVSRYTKDRGKTLRKLRVNRLFIALFTIIILDLGGGLAYADINSGLVAHWPLDGNANDAVGGNNGTGYGDITYVGGVLGQAASFNGFSDYISAPLFRIQTNFVS